MDLLRSHSLRRLYRALRPLEEHHSSLIRSSRSYFDRETHDFSLRGIMTCSCMMNGSISRHDFGSSAPYYHVKETEVLSVLSKGTRSMSTQGTVSPQHLRQGALKVTMLSPGIVFEPYRPRERIPFWRRWFTPSGWRRTKEDVILELKNAYAIARLRKVAGYSKKLFYQEAIKLYKEINVSLANGDKASLRKLVTENMFSAFKNDIKRRESVWSSVHWELVEPVVKIRTLRARMIGIDKNDLDKSFIQLTLEFLTKQKFEAYNSYGVVVSGDKTKEVLVRDIWVFERSLFHPGACWRLCARLSL